MIATVKLQKFLDVLDANGDMFFSSGDEELDLAQVEAVLENQGYWAGISDRYYFDSEFNLLRTEERKFGK